MSVLAADGIEVRFADVIAVRHCTLAVAGGEVVAVTGPSGAGKSSLLGALAGLYAPALGTVRLDGIAVGARADALAKGVVLVPQGNVLVAILSALENTSLPLLARGKRRPRAAALAALRDVGLGEATDQLVEELSGGQQQRLALARGLAEQGSVVLADEPTSELDAVNRGVVMQLLRAEADRGAAVIIATHDPEAAALCNAEFRLEVGAGRWIRDDRR